MQEDTSPRGAEEPPVLEDPDPIQPPAAEEQPTVFTQEDLNRVRREEKDKLYPELDRMKHEMQVLLQEKEAREAAEAAARESAEAEARARREEEMTFKELLAAKEQEWAEQLQAERLERETAIAALEKERQFMQLQEYRSRRVDESRDSILPELVDLISGNSEEEIEASIRGLTERSERILASTQQAMNTARRDSSGARVTSPPTEPLDAYSGSQSFTPDQVRDMSMQEYEQYREQFLGKGSQATGMFG
jgi:DNA repair exonuclease SbcCD ATPase subunit